MTETKQLSRATSSLYSRDLISRRSRRQYLSKSFLEVLARKIFDGAFERGSACSGRKIDLQQRIPLAKSLLYHLRNLGPGAIDSQSDGIRAAIFAHASRKWELARPVDVALDINGGRSYRLDCCDGSVSKTICEIYHIRIYYLTFCGYYMVTPWHLYIRPHAVV